MDYLDLDDCDYLDLDMLENPYGKRIGGGYETVLTGPGGRSHIKGENGKPLCMQRANARDVRPSHARVVTCYRCIKIMGMNANAPLLSRDLTTAHGQKRKHLMVPGGRQGRMVAEKKLSPFGETGAAPFKRGPANHPTQPWMTSRVVRAKTREERLREEGVALPAAYVPPEYAASVESPGLYVSPKRARSREAKQLLKAAAAAEAAAANALVANPRRTGAKAARLRTPAQAEAALAMYVHQSGQARSLADAWAKLRSQDSSLRDRFGDKIVYTVDFDPRRGEERVGWYSVQETHEEMMRAGHYNNPRRNPIQRTPMTAAQKEAMRSHFHEMRTRRAKKAAANKHSDATRAMKLFHSGEASSLAEAWQMVREQNEAKYERLRGHANPRRR